LSEECHSKSRSVFVTGATSGIGLATANLLRDTGFRIFGGVEPGESADALAATGAELVSLDVTDPSSLKAACREVGMLLRGAPPVGSGELCRRGRGGAGRDA
jgi:NAD(P)-dependent dehydrogenase (short-subunit alcohol dehydrogenase family)